MRRAGGVVLVVLGGVGLLACGAGVVGTWRAHAALGRANDRAGDAADRALGLAAGRVAATRGYLTDVSARLGEAGEPGAADRVRDVLDDAAPRLEAGGQLVGALADAVEALNAVLDLFLDPDGRRLDPAAVRERADQLGRLAVAARVARLLAPVAAGRTIVEIQSALSQAVERVDRVGDRVAAARAEVAAARQTVADKLVLGAVAATVGLIWVAAGQVCLVVRGVAWARGR